MIEEKFNLHPQEQEYPILENDSKFDIGVAKENNFKETRVAITPDDAGVLVNNDINVFIEQGAGEKSGFSDIEYSKVGCYITTQKEVFAQDLIFKVAPIQKEEIELLTENQKLVSPFSYKYQSKEILEKLQQKKVTSIFYNYIKDKNDNYLLRDAIGQVEGKSAIFMASEIMSNPKIGSGNLLGGVTGIMPSEISIIGANKISKSIIESANGLGALVKVFDFSLHNLEKLKTETGGDFSTSLINKKALTKAMMRSNVVISTLQDTLISTLLITEDMISKMKPKSIIIDLSVEGGGMVETPNCMDSKSSLFVDNQIIYCCTPNISAKFPRTTSILLSSIFSNYILYKKNKPNTKEYKRAMKDIERGIFTHKGKCTNEEIANMFDLEYNNIFN